MTERQKLIKILYFHVKYLESLYHELKTRGSEYKYYIQSASRDFKKAQKVLEYMRKGNKYLIVDGGIFSISLFGRDTWRKVENQKFEISIDIYKYKLYEYRIIREIKLRRILND